MTKNVLRMGGGILVAMALGLWFSYLYVNIVSYPYGLITCSEDRIPLAPGGVCRSYVRNFGVLKNDVDAINANGTLVALLFDAVPGNKEDLLVALLKSGVKVNSSDNKLGMTPLHDAAASDNFEVIIPLLLAHGADLHVRDKQGRTPLEFAEFLAQVRPGDRSKVIRLLKEAGG